VEHPEGEHPSVSNVIQPGTQRDAAYDTNGTVSVTDRLVADLLRLFQRYGLHPGDGCDSGGAAEPSTKGTPEHTGPAEPTVQNELALTGNQLRTVAQMCEDACASVTAGIETCRDCDSSACRIHARAIARANRYRAIARQLGAHLTS
jgi:hypothetical protein